MHYFNWNFKIYDIIVSLRGEKMGFIAIQIGLILFAYLIGSIPNGLWIGKVFLNIDLRQHGSKNIGASNALRVMGLKLGILTFALDALKGALPIIIVRILKSTIELTTNVVILDQPYDYEIMFGVVAVLGHTFPLFNHFKGGKAVASSAGIVLTLTPIAGILCILTYIITVILTKYASLGSTFAALSVFIVAFIEFWLRDIILEQLFVLIVYSLMILFIFYRHRENYKRLLKGTENKMSFTKKKA